MTASGEIWFIHKRYHTFTSDMTHSYATWLIHTWHDSFICDMTHSCATWVIKVQDDSFTCYMTHSCVTQFSCVSLTHSYRTCIPTVETKKQHKSIFFRVSSFSVLKHTTACLLACIFLLFCEKRRKMDASRHAVVCLQKKVIPKKKVVASIFVGWRFFKKFHPCFFFFVWLFFGHRIWVERIWAWLKETWIALHLICALYAIKRDVYPMKRGE